MAKKPRKVGINALLPAYFSGKKFNYRMPLEVTTYLCTEFLFKYIKLFNLIVIIMTQNYF